MQSIIEELEKLSGSDIGLMDRTNYNRYIVQTHGLDKTKTAYCFSVPIYNVKSGNLVDLHFTHRKNTSSHIGSEARVSISEKVRIQNQYGICDVLNIGKIVKRTEKAIFFERERNAIEITPTLNGVVLKFEYNSNDQPKIRLRLDRAFSSTRSNEKYFSIMREQFVPFVTASCIGVLNAKGQIVAPCEVRHKKISDWEYDLEFFCDSKKPSFLAIELNLQETKLFQDTTVESHRPKVNNAFGGIAFLGNSKQCGEQWLYSRLETSNLPQLQGKRILKTVLHIPQLGKESSTLSVHRIAARFCSFGSNWQNKIAVTDPIAESTVSNGYYHLDLTKAFGNLKNKSENFVIRVKNKTDKPVMIPTGDNFYAPQILEVQCQ